MLRRTVPGLLALALLGVLAVLGCGMSNPHPLGSYERALAFREGGKNQDAVDAYAAFLRRSPTDSLAALAQFEKAQSYMALKEYPLAVVEFQILRQEYPTSELAEASQYQECLALMGQLHGVDRDITPAHEAREKLLGFLRTYPDSEFADEARGLLTQISDLVVRKQMRSVELYRRLKKPESAAIVMDRLLATERRSTLLPRVLLARAEVARGMGQGDEADGFLRSLVDEYPDSAEAARAQKRLQAGGEEGQE
ncbi:MAG TPA: outer membrane protein assembly factor BamD [Candidatus Krumholzibacteria bacterium]|mgnify:CR=1 FL=1|nr:outer membrane protein assembly factor BamD [Candidatus Krumholzibacteria bacterium]HRX50454.1 outer membrane protein assembly factor BamD [Candidatus Krumholzibacteria bacterium]